MCFDNHHELTHEESKLVLLSIEAIAVDKSSLYQARLEPLLSFRAIAVNRSLCCRYEFSLLIKVRALLSIRAIAVNRSLCYQEVFLLLTTLLARVVGSNKMDVLALIESFRDVFPK
jgi:hypothetical protein